MNIESRPGQSHLRALREEAVKSGLEGDSSSHYPEGGG